jgi:SAM-dependent methyltransferase
MQSLLSHSTQSYEALLDRLLVEHPLEVAMAAAVGSQNLDRYRDAGDGHVAVLRHYGLKDGMSIYDLGCGSGRTAQALIRSGWKGNYQGADIIQRLVDYLNIKCEGYDAVVNNELTILSDNSSLDIVYHWSVFTHLFPEECYNYMRDIHRSLKPGGKMIFSFLEMENDRHFNNTFLSRVGQFKNKYPMGHLDTFLHRDWIRRWADRIGFTEPVFTDGMDTTNHPPTGQALAVMDKRA